MTVMVIGIDPGVTTGVGILSAKGVVDAVIEALTYKAEGM